jgi:filamentous hemagglutinin family protein
MKSHASMNRIYRLVWNAALSLWVAVAENAKGRGKGGSARSSVLFGAAPAGAAEGCGEGSGFRLNTACRAALVLLTSLAVLTHEAGAADAANASVSAGAGSVSTVGNTTTINQASQRMAIDWTSLSTAASEALRFNQPNAAAIALNRITGSSPSELLGSLTANGQVFILNPNGVLFGAGSQVNVGGLVASTLSMSNADFMAGNHVFTGSGGSGSVVNQGTLTAANGGYIALLAPEVRNEGVIGATLGTALLAAGNKVTLNIENGNLLGYSIDQAAINALADNRHLIKADGGQVILTASATDALLRTVVNNSGIIEAKTLNNQGGVIRLEGGDRGVVHVSGTLDASGKGAGERGGKVQVTGDKVGLFDDAKVDVSGDAGGGTALIGGDFQGANAVVKNASATYVGADVNVTADAINSGDGGKVIVWSDGITRYNGSISAKGGATSGNGGFVEVSGKGLLAFKGEVDTSAAHGRYGTLLLDPTNIWIAVDNASADAAAGYAVGDSSADGGAGQPFAASGAVDDSLLTTASLTAALANNDVTITTSNPDGAGAGNITVVDAVTYTGSNTSTLALLASNNIAINQSISSSNGALNVNAIATGDVSIANGAAINTNGGNVQVTGRDITIGNGSAVVAGYVQLSGQDIIFDGTGAITAAGDVYLGGRNIQQGGTGIAVTANNLSIRSSGYIGNSAAAVAGDDKLNTQVNTLSAVAPGAISVSNTGALTVDTVTFQGMPPPNGGAIVGVSSTGGAISLATVDTAGATDNLTLNKAVSTTGGIANTITLAADDHYAQNAATVSTVGANVTISAGRTLTASGSGGSAIVTSGAPSSTDTNGSNAGNIQLSTSGANGGSITVTGDLTAQGSSANAGSTTGNAGNAGGRGGDVTVTTATAGAGIAITGNVLANGGNGSGGGTNFAWMFGTGGNGGNITLRNTGNTGAGAISVGNLTAQGGMAGYIGNGGSGGTVIVTTAGTGAATISTGAITTWGGKYVANSQPGNNGGSGGSVTLGTVGVGASIQFGNLDAHGGAGSLNRVNTNYGSITIASGAGGTVGITTTGANADITGSGNVLSFVENAGCSNSALCAIGAAGNVTMTASNGSVGLAGSVNAKGGSAVGGGTLLANNGGAGGAVTVTAGGINHNVSIGSIDATGGNPLGGGTAGTSKAVVVTAADGYVQQVPGGWFNGSTVAVTANRGIGAGTGAGDLSQRLGIIPVAGTARNATGTVANRAGNTRVIFGGGNVSLTGTQVQNLFTTGDLDIATSNGALTVNGLGRNGAGNISLSAGGGNDLTINASSVLSAVNGNIRLEAGRDVIFSGNASAQTTTGDIYVSAGANVQQADVATALTANNLALRAGGYIGDGAGGDNTLNTSVNAVSAVAGAGIAISNNKALAIDQVTFAGGTVPGGAINGVSTTGTGNVAVGTTGGQLTVLAPVSVADGTLALSGATNLVLNNTVSNATRAVQLTAGSGSIMGPGLVTAGALTASAATGIDLLADAAALTATSTSGSVIAMLAAGGSIENVSTTGTVYLEAVTGSLDVKTVSGSDVTLRAAAGAITDANGTDNNITAATLTASSQGGIALGTDVSGLQTLSTTGAAGDISISTANAINTANYSISTDTGSAQNVSLTSSSASGITVGNAFASTNDNIGLTATAGGINLTSAIDAAGLALSAQGSISAPAAINVSGVFDLKAGTFSQVGTLPSFSANDFRITGGTFVRALAGDGLSTGTAYQIADIYGLQGAGSAGMLDKNYKLANNIDASGTASWNAGTGFNPIGSGTSFTGSLDGNGHVIDQLFINRASEANVGLTATLNGAVSNLGLTGGSVTGDSGAGALAGSVGTGGAITNSHSSAAVTANIYAGGLAGHNAGLISNSYAMGNVTAVINTGGLAGTNSGTVTGSYATGNVLGSNAGGLAGVNTNAITNSYASGAVGTSSDHTTGGLAGINSGTITNSYANGLVAGSLETGGLVGWDNGGTVNSSFWDTQTSGQAVSGGGMGKTSAEMMQASTFTSAGWSASNLGGDGTTWRIYEGHTGPLLRGFLSGLTLANTNVTYNGNTQAGATTATAGVSGSNASARNAGSYVTGYYSGQQGYDIIGGGLDIAKADLTFTTTDVSKTYDGNLSAVGTAVVTAGTALLGGDTASGGSFAFTDKNAGTGNKSVTTASVSVNDGNGGNNYNVSYVTNTSSTITPKALTYSTAAANKTYDGNTTATATLGLTGLVGTETVTANAGATFNTKDVATANLVTVNSATLADGTNGGLAGNYSIAAGGTAAANITAKALTYSTAASNKTYDGSTNATATLSGLTGLVGTETVTATSTDATFNTKDVATANLVTVNSAALADGSNGGLASNYSIAAGGTAAANITAKALTYSTAASNKTYDGNTTATATLSGLTGLVGTETVTASSTGATFNTKDVATANLVTVNGATLADGSNGGLASNYTIAAGGTAAANITAKALTYSTAATNKTYDGNTTATATLSGLTGLVGTETVTASSTGATFNTKDVATANLVTVNSATLADGSNGGLAGNYSIAAGGTAAANITAKALTYSTAASNKTYDGNTTATATLSGLTGLVGTETVTASSTGATFNTKDVATANLVTVNSATLADGSNGGLASNYSIAAGGTAAANVTAKALTYSTTASNKTYDGNTTASAGLNLIGLVNTETLGSTAGATFNTKDVATANLVTVNSATLSDGNNGGLASNYSVAAGGTAAANITAKALTYSTAAANKTYDGSTTASATLSGLTGLVGAETVTASSTGATFNTKDVATANLVTVNGATLADGSNGGLASNYSIAAGGTAAANITAKALTYSTAAANKAYDGSTTATATLSGLTGLVGTETVTASAGATFNTKDVLTANLVTVNSATLADGSNGGLASNYSIAAGGTAAANITAKALTYSTAAANKTYDGGTTAAATLSGLTGLVGTETVTASAGATFNTKDVLTANLVTVNSATLADGSNGGLASNYSIAAGGTAAANITAKALTYSTTASNKTYDGNTTATATLSGLTGLVGTETVTANSTGATFNTKDVATANLVTVNSAALADGSNGGLAGNYSIAAGGTAAANITAKALTYSTAAANKTYDGNTTATATLSGLTGLVGTETVTAGAGATFNTKDVATANLVTVNSATLADGSNGGLASNYSIAAGGTAAANITAKALTYSTAAANKTYDGNTTATATLSGLTGLVGTETVTATSTGATFNTKDVATANLVTVNSAALADGSNGGLASNYSIAAGGTAAANVTTKALTYSTAASNKTYDGNATATATLSGLSGLVGTETVTASAGATFNTKDVATANLVTVNSATLADGSNGGLASNYSIAAGGTAAANITAKALTYSTTASNKTYDGNTTASASLNLMGLVNTETLGSTAGATFNTKDVATANLVTVNSATLSDGSNGGLASNYSVAAGGTAAANITAKALTYSTAAASKTYDGSTTAAATLSGLTGLVGTETVTATSTGATFNTKDVATANLVTVNGATLADGSNGGLASNYSIAAGGTAAANITAKALTYSTAASNKTYDGNTTATATLSGLTGLVGTETVTASSTGATFNTKDVATANLVTVNGAALANGANGGLASNYSIAAGGTAAANITARDLTVTATGVNKVYDGTMVAAVGYGDNRVAGDVLGITGTAAFADRNAGSGKTVNVNGISTSGSDAGNYNLLNTTATTTASITPKALTVTANNDSKNYDGTAYSGGNGVSYNGFVAGDSSADIGGALAYGGSSQGAVAAGSYLITPGGLNSISGNYALGFVDGALSITTSNASTAALGNAGLVSSYDSALQAVAGVGGSSGGGGGGFGGGAAAADALAAAAAEAGSTDEK